ncbi:MAG: hypothetical protein QXQ94_08935 [Candidatus Bathyarchaeia archaeon]
MKCGLALDVKAAFEMDEARTTADNVMNILMKKFRKMLAKNLRNTKFQPKSHDYKRQLIQHQLKAGRL